MQVSSRRLIRAERAWLERGFYLQKFIQLGQMTYIILSPSWLCSLCSLTVINDHTQCTKLEPDYFYFQPQFGLQWFGSEKNQDGHAKIKVYNKTRDKDISCFFTRCIKFLNIFERLTKYGRGNEKYGSRKGKMKAKKTDRKLPRTAQNRMEGSKTGASGPAQIKRSFGQRSIPLAAGLSWTRGRLKKRSAQKTKVGAEVLPSTNPAAAGELVSKVSLLHLRPNFGCLDCPRSNSKSLFLSWLYTDTSTNPPSFLERFHHSNLAQFLWYFWPSFQLRSICVRIANLSGNHTQF